jgi:hypothetical protein
MYYFNNTLRMLVLSKNTKLGKILVYKTEKRNEYILILTKVNEINLVWPKQTH